MADKDVPDHVSQLLDEIARDAITATEADLRERLSDANVDPNLAIQRAKAAAQGVVATVRHDWIADLPAAVPEDPSEVRSLLEKLLTMPGAPAQGVTLAFRDAKQQSDHDVRVLTGHLLELIKKNHETD